MNKNFNNKLYKCFKKLVEWKDVIFWLVLLIIVLASLITEFSEATSAKATNIIETYESQIIANNTQINQLEELKNQLHITAEMLRKNETVNNGLDTALSSKWLECNEVQIKLTTENAELQTKVDEERVRQSSKRFVGNFKLTHYCPCTTCNGSYGNKTALGTTLTPYKTIAVDPRVIPLGSKVEIQGKIYIAEDTGGAIKGNRIDVCVSSHSEAYARGVLKNVPVYIVN